MDDEELIQTFEQLEKELLENEDKVVEELASRIKSRLKFFGNSEALRKFLLYLDSENLLEETDLVAEWHELYSTYKNWKEYNERNGL